MRMPKRKKNQARSKEEELDDRDQVAEPSPTAENLPPFQHQTSATYNNTDGLASNRIPEPQAGLRSSQTPVISQFMKPKFARAPIKEAGRVAYLGESSNLSLLVHDRNGTADVVHYPLPETIRGSRAGLTEVDQQEIDILQQRGAFLLPPRQLCDELVEAFFKWVAPVVPVINRSRFMRRYRDTKNPPSLLLLQAILLAGSRVCTNPQLMDANGSTGPAAMTFFKRAKALFDANYEDDRITIVQALVLMGWYWEGPEDVTKNVFYWTRVAITVAQGSGMHRSVENSQLSRPDKRIWKRIWWTLFTRDRSVAVALGRPVHINTDDSDVEMVSEDDFIDDDMDYTADYPPDPIHVQFFLHYVKFTTLCLLHRAHMPPATSTMNSFPADDMAYPSRTIAFQAASMITSIVENLQSHDELRFTPAFIVYSLFSALIMHVYQMRSNVQSVVVASQERITTCMNALKEVSKVWLVAKMVHTLFESILGNKVLEERLQKAAGKRHQKAKKEIAAPEPAPPKRKYDDMNIGYPNGPPLPQVSYERSRPQTPAVTPSRDMGQPQPAMPAPNSSSPHLRNAPDNFIPAGNSRGNTRPTSPFNLGYSIPATPPDLFLVTRNSPPISQQLWENFQPDQLFPDGTNIEALSPNAQPVDPALTTMAPQMQGMQGQPMIPNQPGSQSMPQRGSHDNSGLQAVPRTLGAPQMNMNMAGQPWSMQGIDGLLAAGMENQSQDDSWSNSSRGNAPIVPTALNVEDCMVLRKM
ncbi:MAG: hypothetical protein Q9160_000044 [Pyrenula sp. 1 TL-2023]